MASTGTNTSQNVGHFVSWQLKFSVLRQLSFVRLKMVRCCCFFSPRNRYLNKNVAGRWQNHTTESKLSRLSCYPLSIQHQHLLLHSFSLYKNPYFMVVGWGSDRQSVFKEHATVPDAEIWIRCENDHTCTVWIRNPLNFKIGHLGTNIVLNLNAFQSRRSYITKNNESCIVSQFFLVL